MHPSQRRRSIVAAVGAAALGLLLSLMGADLRVAAILVAAYIIATIPWVFL